MNCAQESSQIKSCDCEKNQGQDVLFGKELNEKIEQFLKESPSQKRMRV